MRETGYRVRGHWMLLGLGLFAATLAGCSSAAPAAPTAATAANTTAPAASAKPASPVVASPSASPSAATASPSASPGASAAVAPRPANASLKITSPTADQRAPAGSVQVTIEYSGPSLVAAASATKLDDYHLHYFLDESAAPYIGTNVPVPAGNPKIIHTAATQVTFDNVAAGPHTVVVMLSGSNHISVVPPLSDQVTFTVS